MLILLPKFHVAFPSENPIRIVGSFSESISLLVISSILNSIIPVSAYWSRSPPTSGAIVGGSFSNQPSQARWYIKLKAPVWPRLRLLWLWWRRRSISIMERQGRAGACHLRVASMPIFVRSWAGGWSGRANRRGRESNWMSRSGSMVLATLKTTSAVFCTSQSSSTTTMHLVNMAWPIDQMAFMTLRAWPG